MNRRLLNEKGFCSRCRSRRLRRYGSLARRRGNVKKVHYRGRIRRLRKEHARRRRSRCGTRTQIHWESNDGFSQLYPGVQRGFRSWNDKVSQYSGVSRSPSEMARWDSWTEGSDWYEEEETFKGTRDQTISWIKSYARDSGRPIDFKSLHEKVMKKRPKTKMKTSKFPSYQGTPEPGADTYIPNFSWRHRMKPVQPESNRSRAKFLNVILRIVSRGYSLIKSCLCRLVCGEPKA